MKKVSELSTLCGIDACAIIYSPYESQPEVWPGTLGVQRVLGQFKRMPEMEQSKKMVNQESFIRQRITKATEQLKKQHKDNREKELTEVMYQCLTGKGLQNLMMPDLNDLGWLIDQKLKEINKRIESMKKKSITNTNELVSPQVAQTRSFVATASDGIMGKGVGVQRQEQKPVVDFAGLEHGMQRPQWFNDQWMNNVNPNDHQHHQQQHMGMGFGRGEDMMMMPFGDGQNAMWSSAFFP